MYAGVGLEAQVSLHTSVRRDRDKAVIIARDGTMTSHRREEFQIMLGSRNLGKQGNHPRLRERISSIFRRFYKIRSNEIFCAREAFCLPVQIPLERRYVTRLWSVTRTTKPKLIGQCLHVHTKLRFQKGEGGIKGEERYKLEIIIRSRESPNLKRGRRPRGGQIAIMCSNAKRVLRCKT